jgi:alcohol dehydrogenase (cytochrome c)
MANQRLFGRKHGRTAAALVMFAWTGLQACADAEPASESTPGTSEQQLAASDASISSASASASAGADARGGDFERNWQNGGVPNEVRAGRREWPIANRDYAGTRATFDSRIKAANVATLTPAWAYNLAVTQGGYVGSGTSSALVLDGKVYYQDQLSNVSVLNAKTGAPIWTKQYNVPGGAPNGIAVGWGKVFAASSDKAFVALDAKNGTELWKATIEIPQFGGIGIQPIAYGGLVYLSTVPVNSTSQYSGGVNGTLYALDQSNGKVVWSFKTIKDKDLWGNATVNSGGGAWFPPTVDVQSGDMYWGIGNPGPYPGVPEFPLGSSRPGDNLYTDSVLSLDAKSGHYRWHFQEVSHDLFDLDFQNPPILADVRAGRETRSLVIGSGKTGTVVALDARRGGKFVWRASVGRHQNDRLQTYDDAGVDVYPGSLGGIIAPIAYADETVYVPTVNWGRHYLPAGATPGLIEAAGTGELIALNAADGSVRWKKDLASTPFGGITVVNDLLVTSTIDGLVLVFERRTGNELWRFQGPNGINAPITVAGDLVIVPFGIGPGTAQIVALKLP